MTTTHLTVHDRRKSITFNGRQLRSPTGKPMGFVLYMARPYSWDPPDDQEPLTDADMNTLLERTRDKLQQFGQVVSLDFEH
ncbi:MAG: Imm74 family immunity protein [Rhodocyclaceae bacterium]